jgi:hypothetical protein
MFVAALLAAVQLSAAAESEKCQALGFTGPVCSDCDTLASYVKDEGALLLYAHGTSARCSSAILVCNSLTG